MFNIGDEVISMKGLFRGAVGTVVVGRKEHYLGTYYYVKWKGQEKIAIAWEDHIEPIPSREPIWRV